MSKFKVGDKVAFARVPDDCLGYITQIYDDRAIVKTKSINDFHVDLNCLVLYDETDMDSYDIYSMLKPKLEKVGIGSGIKFTFPVIFRIGEEGNIRCYQESDVIKAIALAYRSGYLRAKKSRPFKIGGEKE